MINIVLNVKIRKMKSTGKSYKDRTIVALDTPSYDAAAAIVEKIGDNISFYKVGLELYTADGERVLDLLRAAGKEIFLDLKLHDIPNTVGRAVSSIAKKKVALTTLHTSGGLEMMKAAAAACESPLKILGVTILTSINEETLRNDVLNERSIPTLVSHLAGKAKEAGLHGVVASALELSLLREKLGDDFLIVTPGIRPAGSDIADQKRVVTPKEAFKRGASYIVVGRPITGASDPSDAARRIIDDIDL